MQFVLAFALAVGAALHPGHGSLALVGTLMATSDDAVTIDVRDVASASTRRYRVLVDDDTRYRVGKEAVSSLREWVGASVVAAVDYEDDMAGVTIYRATKIQISPAKKRR